MKTMADDLRKYARRIEDNAAQQRGHLLGFNAPAAERVRSELQRMHEQAQGDAETLRAIARWLDDHAQDLHNQQQAYNRRQAGV